MNTPMISIVLPVYNGERNLADSIVSCLEQTYRNFEIIIVNDGSKDNTFEIAKRYEAEYPTIIKAIDKENGGHGSTINEGLKIATGKYFRVVDSDDWVDADSYIKLINKLRSFPAINGTMIIINDTNTMY